MRYSSLPGVKPCKAWGYIAHDKNLLTFLETDLIFFLCAKISKINIYTVFGDLNNLNKKYYYSFINYTRRYNLKLQFLFVSGFWAFTAKITDKILSLIPAAALLLCSFSTTHTLNGISKSWPNSFINQTFSISLPSSI